MHERGSEFFPRENVWNRFEKTLRAKLEGERERDTREEKEEERGRARERAGGCKWRVAHGTLDNLSFGRTYHF